MIRSILRGWPWIVSSAIVAALVVVLSWIAEPQVFRTSVELRVLSPDEPQLWDDPPALKRAIAAEGQRIIAVVMGGEVKEAVSRSEYLVGLFDLDTRSGDRHLAWTKMWNRRVMAAGPVDGEVFLIVDDEDGDRGAALAEAVLEALEVEWRRRAEVLRQEGIDRLDRLIDLETAGLFELVEACSKLDKGADQPDDLILVAERDLAVKQVAQSRARRRRLESTLQDQPLPWVVVGSPTPFEHHLRRTRRTPVMLSALAFVLLVGVAWVAYDKGAGNP